MNWTCQARRRKSKWLNGVVELSSVWLFIVRNPHGVLLAEFGCQTLSPSLSASQPLGEGDFETASDEKSMMGRS